VGSKTIRPDGTFKDEMNLVRGNWEAKDTSDKLVVEIDKKHKAGYPLNNIIFEDTQTAIFYQHGQRVIAADMRDPAKLAELITELFRYVKPKKVGRPGPWATSVTNGCSIPLPASQGPGSPTLASTATPTSATSIASIRHRARRPQSMKTIAASGRLSIVQLDEHRSTKPNVWSQPLGEILSELNLLLRKNNFVDVA
jgi:hypothetical protein